MKLYGNPMSTCTRKVLTVLAEHNTPFEMVTIDFTKGEHKAAAYMAEHQPFGQIPAIDDDGFKMFESRAIIRYLDGKHGGSLTPKDAHGRALMEQWISVETSDFTPSAMKLIYQYVFMPMRGQPTSDEVIAEGSAGVTKALAVMETQLTKHPFIAGEQFTLADVGFMPYIGYLMPTAAKVLFENHPHVMTWWNKISARASWQRATGKA
jgi:glutathione S-transferase